MWVRIYFILLLELKTLKLDSICPQKSKNVQSGSDIIVIWKNNDTKNKSLQYTCRDFSQLKVKKLMPYKCKKPCKHPGCPQLTSGSYCDKHSSLIINKRESAERRGYEADGEP